MAEFNWTVDDIKRAQRDFSNNFMRLDGIRAESYDVAIDFMTECIEKKAATEINTLDRDALYNLICKVHATFQKAANECHVAYDEPQDYYVGKAVAYEDVVYTIEQEMKKLYDTQRHI